MERLPYIDYTEWLENPESMRDELETIEELEARVLQELEAEYQLI